jgi:glutamate-1-semialdehyde aminotransferase
MLERIDEGASEAAAARADAEHVEPLRDWNLNPYLHPNQASHGYAGHIVDAEGRDYVDYSSAWGANILGYGYARVAEAVAQQAQRFANVGMHTPEYWELARLLCQVIPGAEAIRYGKNGSDVTMAAVRLARAVTGRERVLHRGYHGFHDWWMASTLCAGIPQALRGLIETVGDLTPESVDAAFRRHPGEIACLIFDPMAPPMPPPEVVREIVAVAHRHGALMIFDEVVSGFRLAPGGVQERWGIRADLACFGKGVANGMPLSILSGRQAHMRHLPATNYGMTFEGESVSIAAGLATVHEILEKRVCEALAEKGRVLRRAYEQLATRYGLASHLAGPDARPYLAFEAQGGIPSRELRWLFIQELAREDILTIGTLSFCYSHDEGDLAATVAAFEKAMAVVRTALDRGSVGGLLDDRVRRSMHGEGVATLLEDAVRAVSFTEAPAAVTHGERLHLFARGDDGALYHRSGDGESWEPWASLQGVVVSSPAAAVAGHRLLVYVRGGDDAVFEKSHDGLRWSGWTRVGGQLNEAPAAASRGEHVEVVVRGRDNQLWRSTRGAWESWTPIGGDADSAPAVAFLEPQQLIAFCRGRDGGLWHTAFDEGGGWASLGGTLASAPAVVAGHHTLDVFVRSIDGQVWSRSFDGQAWAGWTNLGGEAASAPAVTRIGSDLHLFEVGKAQRIHHRARRADVWSDWTELGPAWRK